MSRLSLLLFILLLSLNFKVVCTAQKGGKVWVLAVAIDKYQDTRINTLTYTVQGANDLLRVFENRGLIAQSRPLANSAAGKDQIIDEINRRLVNNPDIHEDDMIIFSFSGHGTILGRDIETICPYDYNPSDPSSLIKYKEIEDLINSSKARHKLVFIEACKSKILEEAYRVYTPQAEPYLQKERQQIAPGFVFITSTEIHRDSYANKDIGGYFNYYLVKGLRGEADGYSLTEENRPKNQIIEIGELFAYIQKKVKVYSKNRQIPQWRDIGGRKTDLPIISIQEEKQECSNNAFFNTREENNLLLILYGTFLMGNSDTNEGDSDERPISLVQLNCYYLSKYEVTFGEFQTFIKATNYVTDAEKIGRSRVYFLDETGDYVNLEREGINWRYDHAGKLLSPDQSNYPVVHVSWFDAINYCNWLSSKDQLTPAYRIDGDQVIFLPQNDGYRLPTEAEWEYAAKDRGMSSRVWAGNETRNLQSTFDYSNIRGDKDGYTEVAPVGSLRPSDLELFDLSGNVREFCWDRYHEDYYSLRKSEAQSKKTISINPIGPVTGLPRRVVRGGSWWDKPEDCRVSNRSYAGPNDSNGVSGFRLARGAISIN